VAEEENQGAAEPPKKSKLGMIVVIVVGVVLLIGGSVAGAVLGPKLFAAPASEQEGDGANQPKEHADKKKKAEPIAAENIVSESLPAIIVDLRDEDGRVRHLKVGLSAELPESVTPEEFRKFIPRARESAVTYLRSLTFEEISDPKEFVRIKTTLSKLVTEALGSDRVHRILLIEFVAQ